jgi:hypothetical protein
MPARCSKIPMSQAASINWTRLAHGVRSMPPGLTDVLITWFGPAAVASRASVLGGEK